MEADTRVEVLAGGLLEAGWILEWHGTESTEIAVHVEPKRAIRRASDSGLAKCTRATQIT